MKRPEVAAVDAVKALLDLEDAMDAAGYGKVSVLAVTQLRDPIMGHSHSMDLVVWLRRLALAIEENIGDK